MLRCSILYVFSLTVGFVAASYIDDVGQCFDTCTMRATSVAGCSLNPDWACLCGSTAFHPALIVCIQQTCPDILSMLEKIIEQDCAVYTENLSKGPHTKPTPAPTPSPHPASSSALKSARVAGGIGALAALVSTAIF